MKILIIGAEDRYARHMPEDIPVTRTIEKIFLPRGASDEEIIAAGRDCEFLAADPMTKVSRAAIEGLPHLKMIHSEGVGFNGFDVEAAREAGIYVCNCKGANAGAVAEQTILLILGFLRQVTEGDRRERIGEQMQMKEAMMVKGLKEVSDCKIGLIGFGDIAKATAERLHAFGCELYYSSLHRKDPETEKAFHVTYLTQEELLSVCDVVSLHCAVTDDTRNIVNAEFLAGMKKEAFLVNTARGDLVDNEALVQAIVEERIAGAALDTVFPEPTTIENPLLHLPEGFENRILFSPHVGGATASSMKRSHRILWQAVQDMTEGRRPENIVNQL